MRRLLASDRLGALADRPYSKNCAFVSHHAVRGSVHSSFVKATGDTVLDYAGIKESYRFAENKVTRQESRHVCSVM